MNYQASTNILKAIKTIVDSGIPDVIEYYRSENRINSVGDALEDFAKDIFADSISISDRCEKAKAHRSVFSWGGNANNPPDFMIRGGDAVEVKKITTPTARIALNSSYPSAKLFADSLMILTDCRKCEDWTEKDNIYCIGHIGGQRQLSSLWLVYGDCYAANKEVYERIRSNIINGIAEIRGVELSVTKELARVDKIDPLGITNLRVRGMWDIAHPFKVYDYLNVTSDLEKSFQLFVLMRTSKYLSFPESDRSHIETLASLGSLDLRDVEVKPPNNTMETIAAKLIVYEIS